MTANPFGVVDHRPFSALGLKLAYGRRADGTLAHISEVERGEACGCVCPACERRLVARKCKDKADHFAHKGDTACSYGAETNAHLWAKEVLEVERRIYLPAIEVELEGRVGIDWRGGFFHFDEVRLERSLGSFVPDVVLRAKGRELQTGNLGDRGQSQPLPDEPRPGRGDKGAAAGGTADLAAQSSVRTGRTAAQRQDR